MIKADFQNKINQDIIKLGFSVVNRTKKQNSKFFEKYKNLKITQFINYFYIRKKLTLIIALIYMFIVLYFESIVMVSLYYVGFFLLSCNYIIQSYFENKNAIIMPVFITKDNIYYKGKKINPKESENLVYSLFPDGYHFGKRVFFPAFIPLINIFIIAGLIMLMYDFDIGLLIGALGIAPGIVLGFIVYLIVNYKMGNTPKLDVITIQETISKLLEDPKYDYWIPGFDGKDFFTLSEISNYFYKSRKAGDDLIYKDIKEPKRRTIYIALQTIYTLIHEIEKQQKEINNTLGFSERNNTEIMTSISKNISIINIELKNILGVIDLHDYEIIESKTQSIIVDVWRKNIKLFYDFFCEEIQLLTSEIKKIDSLLSTTNNNHSNGPLNLQKKRFELLLIDYKTQLQEIITISKKV